jgi:uncharacterized protein (TIGR03083 family)
MNRDEIWRAVDTQRLAICDLLDQLSDDEWRTASLCDGWTVRDVAAHLTLQQIGPADVPAILFRWPGVLSLSMNRMIQEMARRQAALPTATLIARNRAMAGVHRHNFGITNLETLIDILVHSQDIAVPLGRPVAMDQAAAAVAASRVWSRGWPFYPRRRFAGLRLVATNTDWAVGEGSEVRGPIEALLLLVTGRGVAAQSRLTGAGVADPPANA